MPKPGEEKSLVVQMTCGWKKFNDPSVWLPRCAILLSIFVLYASAESWAQSDAGSIDDPIKDYLAMNVPDRETNTGGLWILKKVEVDPDKTGQPWVFVGTWYRKSGPNTWLWAGYKRSVKGYVRITPVDADVLIDFRKIYVGLITALHRNGMVQAYSLELDNQDRSVSNEISDLEYYYEEDDKLIQQSAGALDLSDPSARQIYDHYFTGPPSEIKEEQFNLGELVKKGYQPPAWTKRR